MTKPIEKVRRELVHHPSDALDAFCQYDSANRRWREFDDNLSHQLLGLEFKQRHNIRLRLDDRRQRASA
jgi:hypothetical protein